MLEIVTVNNQRWNFIGDEIDLESAWEDRFGIRVKPAGVTDVFSNWIIRADKIVAYRRIDD